MAYLRLGRDEDALEYMQKSVQSLLQMETTERVSGAEVGFRNNDAVMSDDL